MQGLNAATASADLFVTDKIGLHVCALAGNYRGSPKKKWGTPETILRQRFLNNLGLHTRTLIHV